MNKNLKRLKNLEYLLLEKDVQSYQEYSKKDIIIKLSNILELILVSENMESSIITDIIKNDRELFQSTMLLISILHNFHESKEIKFEYYAKLNITDRVFIMGINYTAIFDISKNFLNIYFTKNKG